MSALIYQIFTSSALLSLGLYHLISTVRNFLKSPQTFSAKPFHPLSISSSSAASHLRLLPLYLTIAALSTAFLHSTLSSADPDPLIKGHSPVHHFTSLQSAAVSFLFLLLCLSLLLSESTSLFSLLPSDLFFALASAAFFLASSVSSSRAALQTSDLQSRCDSLSSTISLLSSLLCLALALFPRLFVCDVCLAASVCLHGLWALQTGLSLYVEAFIPEGCHRLLDVVSGVEGSTKCELEDSKLRAVAILDLAFVIHVGMSMILIFLVYAVVSKALGVSRRFGSYEVLPTAAENTHVQLKTLSGTQA
ncbi:hypothetical protein SOVF_203400 [Spinacia oleracea]|uniref:Uncharacterized protein n=1 Tax=Spinacia oleracea TaxID=3562 RepID=A0A9R0IXY3_SPIOL|nr:uncharacterized protein LOC110796408 [Spinacia oleracea]KNA04022.1 hypothetical protein SOVF_203400 [Spinacia oleracea]